MNCPACSHKNPATVSYCQKCGGKMDLTADEIRDALIEKAKGETAKSTEFYARQALVFSAVLLLVAITVFYLALGAPEGTYFIPSCSKGTKYVEFKYKHPLKLEKIEISVKKK